MPERQPPRRQLSDIERARMVVGGMPEYSGFACFAQPPTVEQRVLYFREEAQRFEQAASLLTGEHNRVEGEVRVSFSSVFPDVESSRDRYLEDGDLEWVLRLAELTRRNVELADEALEKIETMRTNREADAAAVRLLRQSHSSR